MVHSPYCEVNCLIENISKHCWSRQFHQLWESHFGDFHITMRLFFFEVHPHKGDESDTEKEQSDSL